MIVGTMSTFSLNTLPLSVLKAADALSIEIGSTELNVSGASAHSCQLTSALGLLFYTIKI